MADSMNKPALRFKGFTVAWEQRKLGDVVDRIVRKNTNNESSLPLTISAQYGLVDQITYFNNRVASRDVSNYYLVLNGEFAYNKSTSDGYPFGAVKRLDLYEKGVLSTLYIVFAPKNDKKINSDFLAIFFDTDRWHKGVAERAAEGARNHGLLNISAEDFFDIDISVPKDVAEQKQIGMVIRNFDNLITLHQRKYAKLLNIKASMLEKMFPKDGSAFPEVRFSGFTEAWEQRKLGEVAIITKGEQINKSKLSNSGKYYVLNGGMTPSGYTDTYNTKANTISISEGGNSCGFVNYNFEPFWSGGHNYTLINPKIKVIYLYQILKFIEPQIMALRVGSGLPNIQKSRLSDVEIVYPSEGEQARIGKCLESIDHLITLHQRKLEKLQNIKKSLLEKMFV